MGGGVGSDQVRTDLTVIYFCSESQTVQEGILRTHSCWCQCSHFERRVLHKYSSSFHSPSLCVSLLWINIMAFLNQVLSSLCPSVHSLLPITSFWSKALKHFTSISLNSEAVTATLNQGESYCLMVHWV